MWGKAALRPGKRINLNSLSVITATYFNLIVLKGDVVLQPGEPQNTKKLERETRNNKNKSQQPLQQPCEGVLGHFHPYSLASSMAKKTYVETRCRSLHETMYIKWLHDMRFIQLTHEGTTRERLPPPVRPCAALKFHPEERSSTPSHRGWRAHAKMTKAFEIAPSLNMSDRSGSLQHRLP